MQKSESKPSHYISAVGDVDFSVGKYQDTPTALLSFLCEEEVKQVESVLEGILRLGELRFAGGKEDYEKVFALLGVDLGKDRYGDKDGQVEHLIRAFETSSANNITQAGGVAHNDDEIASIHDALAGTIYDYLMSVSDTSTR
jgi:hypothetical protein